MVGPEDLPIRSPRDRVETPGDSVSCRTFDVTRTAGDTHLSWVRRGRGVDPYLTPTFKKVRYPWVEDYSCHKGFCTV